MSKINGGTVGKSNLPTFLDARGIWLNNNIENARRRGSWPLALSNYVVAVTHDNDPQIVVYPWTATDGFGNKYNNPSVPVTVNTSQDANGVVFNSLATQVFVAFDGGTSYFSLVGYLWNSDGFGTKYADPGEAPLGNANKVALSPDNNVIAGGGAFTERIYAYQVSSAGFGTKYSQPTTLPNGISNDCKFNHAGDQIAVTHSGGAIVTAYPWSNTNGFGTKYNDPSVAIVSSSSTGYAMAFGTQSDYILIGHSGGERLSAYRWNSAGFGTRYVNPSPLPPATVNRIIVNSTDSVVFAAHVTSPRVSAYQWTVNNGFGTKYADPTTIPTGDGKGVALSPTETEVVVSHLNTPFVSSYTWSNTVGFGTKYANPTILPRFSGNDVAFGIQKI